MTTPKHEARAIFDQAIEHTRGLSPATFDQWFGGVQFEDLTDGVLTLRAQNEFVLEWVRDNFLPTLAGKIRDLTGWSVEVVWMLDPHLEAPVAKRAQIAPVRPRPLVVRPSAPPPLHVVP
ncbi:MAG: chromosomal replication initiator protein DnaA, partial [Polyangiaceae bacterium]|nr:chromosomal replication initiator protein DnaA [Polyangiaceae bacterium]